MIYGLDRKHDAALDQVLPKMRPIPGRVSAEALSPLAGAISKLIKACSNTGENKVIGIQYVVGVVFQLLFYGHALPSLFAPIGSRLGRQLARLGRRLLSLRQQYG
jgi:hypothetical protein